MALYIAAEMYASIVATALLTHYPFGALGITPASSRRVKEVTRFAPDSTVFLTLGCAVIAVALAWLHMCHTSEGKDGSEHEMNGGKRAWVGG